MGKIFKSLPFKLLLGVVVGILLGLVANEAVMNVVVTVKQVLGQIITFCVPLIVIGFIAPSITKLGHNASRMLMVALVLAYCSSVGAALASASAGYAIIPHLSIVSQVDGLKELPEVLFQLEIPPLMNVMSALALSLMVGLAITWTKSKRLEALLDEIQNVVLAIVSKIIIPLLPFFIASTFCGLAYEGTITKQFPVFIKVIIIVMVGHYLWMLLLYAIAGAYSGKNPIEVVKHYGPAYITAVGTLSSAATLAVALRCAKKSSGTMVLFCMLLGIFAIGAPGVPGGTVMASLGLITGILLFDGTGTALMLTIFALQDSFGTACNVTGDGALTLILTGYADRHKIAVAESTAEE